MHKRYYIFFTLMAVVLLIVLLVMYPNQTFTISTSVMVEAPTPKVYQELVKIDQVDDWFFAVHRAEYVSTLKDTVGCIRECNLEDGSVVREKMTHAIENQLISMEMIQHSLPVDFFRWDIRTKSEGNNRTLVTQDTKYQVRFGLLGVVLNYLVIKNSLQETLEQAYLGFKSYIEDHE